MGFEVSATKLRVFRFAFFALFALDAWLQIAHAPRYGANDFNVTHFPWLDFAFPMPTRTMMVIVFGVQAYLGVRLALGGVSRALYIALAALFAFGYYISQLNSLQHHYLLTMALCLLAAFPWPDLRNDQASTAELSPRELKTARERNWPIRMLLVTLSVVYFYAAISKMHPLWLDGTTMKLEISAGWMRSLCDSLGWSTVAVLAIAVELALVVLLHIRRLWPLTIAIGISMHLSFEASGLEIGLFSYFMVTLYLLLLPESFLKALQKLTAPAFAKLSSLLQSANGKRLYAWPAFALALVAGLGIAQLLPLPPSVTSTLLVFSAILALGDFIVRRQGANAAIAHLLGTLSLVVFVHSTDTIRDYYRYWGGQERRSGNQSAAIIAYEDLVRYEPSYASGHRRLGDLYRTALRVNEAIAEYEAGLAIEPDNFALNKAAAQVYHVTGKGELALQSAERALASDGMDQALRRIRDHWKKRLRPNATRP